MEVFGNIWARSFYTLQRNFYFRDDVYNPRKLEFFDQNPNCNMNYWIFYFKAADISVCEPNSDNNYECTDNTGSQVTLAVFVFYSLLGTLLLTLLIAIFRYLILIIKTFKVFGINFIYIYFFNSAKRMKASKNRPIKYGNSNDMRSFMSISTSLIFPHHYV